MRGRESLEGAAWNFAYRCVWSIRSSHIKTRYLAMAEKKIAVKSERIFLLNYARVKARPRSNHIPKFFQSVWHQRPSREEMYIKRKKKTTKRMKRGKDTFLSAFTLRISCTNASTAKNFNSHPPTHHKRHALSTKTTDAIPSHPIFVFLVNVSLQKTQKGKILK